MRGQGYFLWGHNGIAVAARITVAITGSTSKPAGPSDARPRPSFPRCMLLSVAGWSLLLPVANCFLCGSGAQRLFLDTPNVESVFFATFTVASADGSEVELCPGGATRAVTDSNKSEYVDLLIQYRFNKELERPIREMLHGLTAILPSQLLRAVTEDELLLLVAGEPQISAEDLRAHLRCGDGYTPSSPPVLLLLQCLANMSHAELSR